MFGVGKRISEYRKSLSMTQEDLAVKIGVSSQTISKWENEVTMPDIMLLPVIADIFETTIDALFGRENTNKSSLSFDDLPKAAHRAILECMQKAWNTANGDNSSILDGAKSTAEYLAKFPDSHSMVLTQNNGFSYAASDIAITYFANNDEAYELLTDKEVNVFLIALSDENLREILYYLTKHQSTFTAASLASKCGITEENAIKALDYLVKFNLIQCQTIEMEESSIKVYSQWGSHKLLLICSILRLAKALSDYQEHYMGFRN